MLVPLELSVYCYCTVHVCIIHVQCMHYMHAYNVVAVGGAMKHCVLFDETVVAIRLNKVVILIEGHQLFRRIVNKRILFYEV